MTKRVTECNICGEPLSAANDEELLGQVRGHMEAEHPETILDLEQAREMIASEAYDAGDS